MYRINIVDDQRKKIEWIAEKDVTEEKSNSSWMLTKCIHVWCVCADALSNTFAILLWLRKMFDIPVGTT